MLTATKESPAPVIQSLKELYRHCLTNRTGPREAGYHVETNHLGLVLLNLGDVNRAIWVGGNSRLYADDQKEKCLPHLVARNPGHIVALLEAEGIQEHTGLMVEQGLFGMHVPSTKCGNSIACFCRGDPAQGAYIELLAHIDEAHGSQEKTFWLAHACIFRAVYGKQSMGTGIDRFSRTRVRGHQEGREDTGITVGPHPGPIDSTRDSLEVVHECKDILAAESSEAHPPSVTGSELDIRRMGLPECRILAFHVNAEAHHKKFSSGAKDPAVPLCRHYGTGGLHSR